LGKLGDTSFVNFINTFDFVCLTETFVGDFFDYSVIFPNFIKFSAPAKKISRQGRHSGGVLVLIKNNLSKFVKEIKLDYSSNIIALQIDKTVFNLNKDVIVVACYINPDGSPAYDDYVIKDGILMLEETLLESIRKDNVYMIVCGDMNARTGNMQPEEEDMNIYFNDRGMDKEEDEVNTDSMYERCSKDKTVNNYGKSFLDFCFLFNLCILNGCSFSDQEGDFTFVSPQGCSVIDYFCVSRELIMNCDFLVLDEVFSWHLPVQLRWTQSNKKQLNFSLAASKTEERLAWSEDNEQIYRNELESTMFLHSLEKAKDIMKGDINKCIEFFQTAMYGAAACMVRKVGRNKREYSDWFDEECRVKKKIVKASLQRFRRAKLMEYRDEKKTEYVNNRKEYAKLIKEKKRKFDEKRLEQLKGSVKDAKLFWKTIRLINRKSIVYNDISIQQWHEHFSNVFNSFEQNTDDTRQEEEEGIQTNTEEDILFNNVISLEEVKESVTKLKTGKSAGPDQIVSEMLKCANPAVIQFLTIFFNYLYDNGLFPLEWSKSIIVPIYKKGNKNNPDNYRGVALTSIVSKVYTYILNKRLVSWAKREEKIIEEQAGFRASYSTVDHIFTLYSLVQKFLAKNTKLYIAFVDFRKAFDSVNRNLLWYTLKNVGVNGKLYRALKGMYESVLSCVRDKGYYSEYFNCPRGVKQGCLLSPQLFSFFVNELAIEISKKGRHGIQLIPGAIEIFLLLFADDVILMSNTVIGLQNQINMLKIEADRLQLCVNLDKTNIMVFRMGGYLSFREKWWFGNTEVKVTNCYKYLGMTFTTKLSLNSGWEEMCRKGKKGVIEILRTMRKVSSIDPQLFWKLFDSQIEPILTYAAEVWGLEENNQMERVHTFAIKRFMNVPIHSSNTMVYGDSGRYPLYVRSYVKCIKYWLRLLKLPSVRLCRQAYEMLLIQSEKGNINWVTKVKNILTVNGFGIVWINQGVGSDKMFLSEFKDRLVSCFKQNWHSKLAEDDRYTWYFSYKNIFQPEKYLHAISKKWHRDMLSRFRTRTLGLRVRKRWFDISTGNQNCLLCTEETFIENETHFMFLCKSYDALRHQSPLFNTDAARKLDLHSLLLSEKEEIICLLAKYIAEANSVRREKLHSMNML
jgi:exonuclease III